MSTEPNPDRGSGPGSTGDDVPPAPEILVFPEYESQGKKLAARLDYPARSIELHRFPDGEALVRLPTPLPSHILLCRSLDQADPKLIELLLVTDTARSLGVERISLISPYLCYMRQDRAFNPGEAVSQRIIGQFLARQVDDLVTVDPHLHRTPRLEEAVPVTRALSLHATAVLGAFLAAQGKDLLLVGPDRESEQWVRGLADASGLDSVIAKKQRHGDRRVTVTLPDNDYRGRHSVIVDDVASTGGTLAMTARALRAAGSDPVNALVTHALFDENAQKRMHAAGIESIWSTDSVPHPTNAICLSDLLAEGVKRLLR